MVGAALAIARIPNVSSRHLELRMYWSSEWRSRVVHILIIMLRDIVEHGHLVPCRWGADFVTDPMLHAKPVQFLDDVMWWKHFPHKRPSLGRNHPSLVDLWDSFEWSASDVELWSFPFVVSLNKLLKKHLNWRLLEMPWWSCDVTQMPWGIFTVGELCSSLCTKTPLYVRSGSYIKQMPLEDLSYIKQMSLEHISYTKETL